MDTNDDNKKCHLHTIGCQLLLMIGEDHLRITQKGVIQE